MFLFVKGIFIIFYEQLATYGFLYYVFKKTIRISTVKYSSKKLHNPTITEALVGATRLHSNVPKHIETVLTIEIISDIKSFSDMKKT